MKIDGIDLRSLIYALFDTTKLWWGLATIFKFCVILTGIIEIFTNLSFPIITFMSVIFTILAGLFQWHSDYLKGISQTILAKFDMYEGVGWEISRREIAHWSLIIPNYVKKNAKKKNLSAYFASSEPPSAKRVLENLQESAWMTKYQAKTMGQIVGFLSLLVAIVGFLVVNLLINTYPVEPMLTNISRTVIMVLVFMFSGGYIRLTFDYSSFYHAVDKIEVQANDLLTKNSFSELDSIKIVYSYHLIRASAPLLPSWLWKIMEKSLNSSWEEHKNDN